MTSKESHAVAARGVAAAATSFLLWGLWPLYWTQLHSISAFELIAHRIVWSLLLLLAVLIWQRALSQLRAPFSSAAVVAASALSGVLLATNWTIYVWAVNSGQVIDSSLGYFLTPLFNVALGFVFLHERLRWLQWTAIAFAMLGVGLLLLRAGHMPWVALSLATSWSLYGILKKKSRLGPIPGLTLEAAILFPFAAALLLWHLRAGDSALSRANLRIDLLLLASGVITTVPLLLFAYGARRIRLATLGLVQYIAPSVQFLLGLWVYQEPFDRVRLHCYALIWLGLLIYTADSFWTQRASFQSATEVV